MKIYRLHRSQVLPLALSEAWGFFSDPHNLARITPKKMEFAITSPVGTETYAGMVITYRVRPIAHVPLGWVSEITHVEKPLFFVDEQRFGPYRFWHHQHLFEAVEEGVKVQDIVHYALPFGPLGRLAHGLFVRRQLEGIFDYREHVLAEIFQQGLGDPNKQPVDLR